MSSRLSTFSMFSLALVAACTLEPGTTGDARHESFFPGGKADGAIDEGSPEALGVLEVANSLDFDTFVGDAPEGAALTAETAESLLAYRAGEDGEEGTDDDRTIETLAELDSIDFVGPVALDRLLDYAWAHDIVPVCGDGIVQVGEECDPPGEHCSEQCLFETTAFRVTSLELRDPHPFTKVLFQCRDIRDRVNGGIADAIGGDEDGDGFLDLSALAAFRPVDPSAEATELDVMLGHCPPPASSTTCEPDPEEPRVATVAHNQSEGVCLDVLPETRGGYSPAVLEPEAPCFASESRTLTVPFGDFEVTLSDAQLAATYGEDEEADPRLTSGLIRGFISEADADALTLPDDIPVVGGDPLSSLLPGGSGNCADHDARVVGPDDELGWYFYLNYEAEVVPFSEPDEGDDEDDDEGELT